MFLTKESFMPVSLEKEDKKENKNSVQSETVMQNLHDRIGVPKSYSHTKALNTYDNRWRINVYAFIQSDVPSLIKRVFIAGSFFVQVDNKGKILTDINRPW
jgi:hypothetical protein